MIVESKYLRTTRTSLQSLAAKEALFIWLTSVLPALGVQHEKLLVVTYQEFSQEFWDRLEEYHCALIPFVDGTGEAQPRLPYFGGLNGSNLYQQGSCVICLGLNRFEIGNYIDRAFACDFCGDFLRELETNETVQPIEQLPSVLRMEDITLTRDLVQLLYRSRLRRHGDNHPISLWVINPPPGVVDQLQTSFPGSKLVYHPQIPEACRLVGVTSRRYRGKESHAAKLLQWLQAWEGERISLQQVRQNLQLTPGQYKEAARHPEVKTYFDNHIVKTGSGKATCIQKAGFTLSYETPA